VITTNTASLQNDVYFKSVFMLRDATFVTCACRFVYFCASSEWACASSSTGVFLQQAGAMVTISTVAYNMHLNKVQKYSVPKHTNTT